MSDNGSKKAVPDLAEHPKNQIEVLSNSCGAIEDYARTKEISFRDAADVLILNELRCLHFHLEWIQTMVWDESKIPKEGNSSDTRTSNNRER